jgi:alkanesulfonate monooxygenase SsuD/methylene tetrahydromethanopterin reductase-like flavin-dependent oxidoreductase (luciferase family)
MNASLDYLRTQPPVRANLERLKPPGGRVEDVTLDYLCDIGQFVVGDPESVARQLRQLYADVGGFGTFLLVAGRDPAPIGARLAMLERFAREVAPALADLGEATAVPA